MLRLTVVSQTPEETVLKVEGWITSETAALLRAEGGQWLDQKPRLILDLDGVSFIDETGFALLQSWPAERVKLRGGSGFIRNLLEVYGIKTNDR
jgi:anti-anti-sigma regulatory factor